jgi:TRAP-type C4-dicarboxylate transport system substrate-binding protein
MVTVVGLAEIDKACEVLSLPMMYKNNAESDYVRSKMQPILEKRLEAKGFKVLNWGEAGWVQFFGKTPILTPDDLKKMKFFIWGDDADMMNIWKSAGFTPIPLSATDILPNLQTGLINCFDTTPVAALSFQWFALAPHMTQLNWCPLIGATIITTDGWNKVPAASRPAILKAAAEAGKAFKLDIRKNSDKAVDVMKEHGLIVHEITEDQYSQWQKLFESVYPQIADTIVPGDILNEAMKYRDEYRAKVAK